MASLIVVGGLQCCPRANEVYANAKGVTFIIVPQMEEMFLKKIIMIYIYMMPQYNFKAGGKNMKKT